MKRVWVLVAACLVPLAVSAQALEFRGVPFGASEEDVRQKFLFELKSWLCLPARSEPKEKSCSTEGIPFGGDPASSGFFRFYEDKLSAVSLDMAPETFGATFDLLVRKYGKPASISRPKLEIKGGALLQQIDASWRLKGGGAIFAKKYSADGRAASVSLISAEELKRLAAKDKPPAKELI